MMFYVVAIMATLFLQNCESISCSDVEVVKSTRAVLRNSTCEGNLCMNFVSKRQTQIDKTCITTGALNISVGCVQYDPSNTQMVVCFCKSDNCNAKGGTQATTINSESFCITSYVGDKPTRTLAPVCSMTVIEANKTKTVSKKAETAFGESFVVPVTQQAPLDNIAFHIGMVHITTGVQPNVRKLFYKCTGNDCNDKVSDSYPTKNEVSCHTNGEERCQGEFCIFATNGTSIKYCLTTHKVKTTAGYEPGIFKYKSSTFYFCKENFCNSDEETAKKSSATKRTQSEVDKENRRTTSVTEEPEQIVAAGIIGNGCFHCGVPSILLFIYCALICRFSLLFQ